MMDVDNLLGLLKKNHIVIPPLSKSTKDLRNIGGKKLSQHGRDKIFRLGINETPWVSNWTYLLQKLKESKVYEREKNAYDLFKEDWKVLSALEDEKMKQFIVCLEKSGYDVFLHLAANIKDVISNDI